VPVSLLIAIDITGMWSRHRSSHGRNCGVHSETVQPTTQPSKREGLRSSTNHSWALRPGLRRCRRIGPVYVHAVRRRASGASKAGPPSSALPSIGSSAWPSLGQVLRAALEQLRVRLAAALCPRTDCSSLGPRTPHVRNDIAAFTPGDLVLISSGVPHTYVTPRDVGAVAVVAHFRDVFLERLPPELGGTSSFLKGLGAIRLTGPALPGLLD